MPAVVFDALGTLLSLDSLQTALEKQWPTLDTSQARLLTLFWFNTTQRDYMTATMVGSYIPIGQIFAGGLERCLRVFGLHSTSEQREEVMKTFSRDFRPCKTAKNALEKLKKAGIDVIVATNGGIATVQGALERGECLEYFASNGKTDRQWNLLSCDEIKRGKTDPLVYQTALNYVDKLGTHDTIWMVAAHHWDLMAAKKIDSRFRGAFVEDEELQVTSAFEKPDVSGFTLEDVVDKIIAWHK